jgi:hypothetical protein
MEPGRPDFRQIWFNPGFLLLFITFLYIVPRTAIAGALLSLPGGAVAIMMQRVNPFGSR